ncbi:hypothetical protein BUALT_Bualt16G0038300 [Buddleja alternifolia]|uniref:CCHC-type domain-containing protein n=1 Tax=Buddleja alternifolia TaxID=168488 RepID=A0AAV6W8T8_9LAMI|nr:hypothetical protein BUALT_Bualt16G0038300 [Buddleja alternifolia]
MEKDLDFNALVDSTLHLNVEDVEENNQGTFESINDFTLIGKILTDKIFNQGAVKTTLLKAWNCKYQVHVNKCEDNKYAFIFKDKGDFDKVLNLAPWSFRGHLVVLSHWDPDQTMEEVNLETTQFWIQASNIPARYITPSSAKVIGNAVGKFIKTDLVSESQRWKKYLRIRTEINIMEPLKDSFSFQPNQGKGPIITVDIRYERLLDFCFICGCIGHKLSACPKNPNSNLPTAPSSLPFGPWLRAESTLSVKPPRQTTPDINPQNPATASTGQPSQMQNPKINSHNTPVFPEKNFPALSQYEASNSPPNIDTCNLPRLQPCTGKPITVSQLSHPFNAKDMEPLNSDLQLQSFNASDNIGNPLDPSLPIKFQMLTQNTHPLSPCPSNSISPSPPSFQISSPILPLKRSPRRPFFDSWTHDPSINLYNPEYPNPIKSKKPKLLEDIPSSQLPNTICLNGPSTKSHFIDVPYEIIHSVTACNQNPEEPSEFRVTAEKKMIITERKTTKWKRLARNRNLFIKMDDTPSLATENIETNTLSFEADPEGSRK